MSNFAERFKQLKQLKDVTYDEIGKNLGLKRRAVQTYADGTRRPDFDRLITLADYFNVSIDYLVGRSDDPRRH